mgnify:CR=1 FL=1
MKPLQRAAVAPSLVAAGLYLLAAVVGSRWEADMFPVVDDFRIDRIDRAGAFVAFEGEMRKRRDCAFIAASMHVGDPWDASAPRERLALQFDDRAAGSITRERGWQRFGPFRVSRPTKDVGPLLFLGVTHRCHPFWETRAIYFHAEPCRFFGLTLSRTNAPLTPFERGCSARYGMLSRRF